MLCLLLTLSSPVSSQDFYFSLPRDQIRDVTPRLGVFVFKSILYFAYAYSFRLTLLRPCSNRCAEAFAVNIKFSIESTLLRLMRLNS